MRRSLVAAAAFVALVLAGAEIGAGAPGGQAASAGTSAPAPASSPGASTAEPLSEQALISRYCLGCHNTRTKAGDFVLEGMDLAQAGEHADAWEKVVRKLRVGLMPPAGRPRPDEATYTRLRTSIERRLDLAGSARPDPGRTEVAHRLNRLEYANADPRPARRRDQRTRPAAGRRLELRLRQHRRASSRCRVRSPSGISAPRASSAGSPSAARHQRSTPRCTASRRKSSSTSGSRRFRSAPGAAP